MSESVQETFLASVADNVADNFFGDSRNVITPSEVKEEVTKEVTKETAPKISNEGVKHLDMNMSAEDLVGEILEKPVDDLEEQIGRTEKTESGEPVKPVKTLADYEFLVKDGVLAGFEDDSQIETKEDLKKLIQGNKDAWQQEAKEQAIKDEFDGLPDTVKFVLEYAKNGGQDFQTLFQLMSKDQEIKTYDVEKAQDQRDIVRNYYAAQGWTADEIEEEIVSLVEGEKLKSHATKLKPKLDKMTQDAVDEQAQQQKYISEQKEKADQFFVKTVVDTLNQGKLGDLKLSKKDQQDIYQALITESYESFGRKTNRLGALLDKIQYVQPDYELLAKVTMYLSDPKAFEQKIRDAANTEVTAQTIKKIKIDQNKQKIGSNYNAEKDTKALPKLRSGFINPFE